MNSSLLLGNPGLSLNLWGWGGRNPVTICTVDSQGQITLGLSKWGRGARHLQLTQGPYSPGTRNLKRRLLSLPHRNICPLSLLVFVLGSFFSAFKCGAGRWGVLHTSCL